MTTVQTTQTDFSDPVIVIGAGPVGVAFAQRLRQRAPALRILVFGDEAEPAYDRIHLSDVLAGRSSPGALSLDLNLPGVASFHDCPIVAIRPDQRQVDDARGGTHTYSRLVLATGSRPFRPAIPGIQFERVYTFRDLRDAERLAARRVASQHTVVIGGGLLGLEAAVAMARLNTAVTVIQQAPHLMNRQLDAEAAGFLERSLDNTIAAIRTGNGVREILAAADRPGSVGGVRLRDGEVIPCDTVVVAAGIQPNTELALAAGIAVGQGIKVNTRMQTSRDGIYAVGECVEFAGQLYGLVGPGLEQAGVAAAIIAGGQATYLGSLSAARLKIGAAPVFSAGIVNEAETRLPLQAVVHRDEHAGRYRKLLISRGQLVGALGYGPWQETPRLQSAITEKRRVFFWQLRRFQRSGSLWSVGAEMDLAAWPSSALVCNCRGVTRGELSRAVAAGCQTLPQLADRTGASTVCGSCEPLLQNLLGQRVASKRSSDSVIIAGLAALAVLLIGLYLQIDVSASDSILTQAWWEDWWSRSDLKQYTGFGLLGLALLGLLVSLKKRLLTRKLPGSFSAWRVWHIAMGVIALILLALHAGFEMGDNLNRWLLLNFLALGFAGAVAGFATSLEGRLAPQRGKQVRHWSNWMHLLVSWPLPALLGFHIISAYYF